MPRRDGKGPQGEGSRTGWGYGSCPAPEGDAKEKQSDEKTATIERPQFGLGRGLGRGFRGPGIGPGMGRGMGRGGFRGGRR